MAYHYNDRTDGMHSRTRKLDDKQVSLVCQLEEVFGAAKRKQVAELFGISEGHVYQLWKKMWWAKKDTEQTER